MEIEKSAFDSVRWLNPLKILNWDELLVSRPHFSFFHSTAWLKVLYEGYGFTPHFACAGKFDVNEVIIPLVEVKSWLKGNRGAALPFTDECPPLGTDPAAFHIAFKSVIDFGRIKGWKYIELRGGRKFLKSEVPASLSFYTHDVDLVADEKKQFDSMDSTFRRAVRKSEKEGVQIEVSQTLSAMHDFYQLQCLTRKRHGLPPQPWAFFVNIHRHILSQNRGAVVLAQHSGRKIAASVYFYLADQAIYKYGASDFSQQQLRGGNLVMWSAMRWLAQKGIKRLNLGKTSMDNDGLRKFKLNLGAREDIIEYVKYDLQKAAYVVEADSVTGWHNRVFQVMPSFASQLAGRLLYRHWA